MSEERRIPIGALNIVPFFDMPAWEEIEQRFDCTVNEVIDRLDWRKRGWVKTTIAVTTILCNRALELSGEEKNLDEKTVGRLMPPAYAKKACIECLNAIGKGLRTTYKREDEGPVDLVLREIEKKEEPEE